jgi:predicted ATP-grasp superfamily ATP-dependent carboligase
MLFTQAESPRVDRAPAGGASALAPPSAPRGASRANQLAHSTRTLPPVQETPVTSRALPPALILGGEANALSVARDLGRIGVRVYAVGEPDSAVRWSRHCRWIHLPAPDGVEAAWTKFLTGPDSDFLRGAVVLTCSDAGLRVLTRHRAELLARFKLDLSDRAAQAAMLDKLATYKHAAAAGVTTPKFWEVTSRDEVLALKNALVFPLMIKPRLSHLFEQRFGRKHMIVASFDELLATFDRVGDAGLDVLLMEVIPGGDDLLCSYYTYLDEAGEPQLHFTKRIIRRYPVGMGTACYHVTDWVPEIVEPSLRLFRHVGLRGLANVEYKLDPRDGKHKLIECNARFTASNGLVSASGVNLAAYVYNRLTGRPAAAPSDFRTGLRLWDPVRDFWSYRELSRAGQLTLTQWLRGLAHAQTFPFFAWTDPMPAVARGLKPIGRIFGR